MSLILDFDTHLWFNIEPYKHDTVGLVLQLDTRLSQIPQAALQS